MSFQNLTQANPYNLFCNSISNSSGLITSGEAIRFDSVINNSGGYAYFNNLFATGTVEITTLEAANANLGVLQADSILSLSTVTGFGDFNIGGNANIKGDITGYDLSVNNASILGDLNVKGSIVYHGGIVYESDVYVKGDLFIDGNAYAKGEIYGDFDLTLKGDIYANNATLKGDVYSYGLFVGPGGISSSGGDITSIDANISTIAGNISSGGSIYSSHTINSSGNINSYGNIFSATSINASGLVNGSIGNFGSINSSGLGSFGSIGTKGDVNIGGSLSVNGSIAYKGDVTYNGNYLIKGDLGVTGLSSLNGGITTNGASIALDGGNLNAEGGNINSNGGNINSNSGTISSNGGVINSNGGAINGGIINGATLNVGVGGINSSGLITSYNGISAVAGTTISTDTGNINSGGQLNCLGNINCSGGMDIWGTNVYGEGLTLHAVGGDITSNYGDITSNYGNLNAGASVNAGGTITGGYINSLGDLAVAGNIFDTGYINIGAANNQIQLQPGSTGTQFNISLPTNPAGNVTASIYDPITPSAYLMLGVQPTLFYSNSAHPTLTVAQSGTTVFIISDAVYTITLPDISSGVIGTYFKFIFSTRTGANVISLNTVTANNGKFTCSIVNGGITASTAGAAQNTIRFETTAIPGDYVECISNGALWLCNAACATGGNITCP